MSRHNRTPSSGQARPPGAPRSNIYAPPLTTVQASTAPVNVSGQPNNPAGAGGVRQNILQPLIGVDLTQRPVPTVPPPRTKKPTDDQFYASDPQTGERKPNPAFLKEHFFHEGRLTEQQALYIIEHASNIMSRDKNLVYVKSPVTICGDIHGQYYDLMKLFEVGGPLDESVYLFLGDYVDRGDFGIECLLYLYSLKIWDPKRIVLLRGNHECRHLTEYFTFKRECLHKYSDNVYEACVRSFFSLPLAAIVDNRFFCVHGGLSPQLVKVEDINNINRFQEPGQHGLLVDLLWADPITNFGQERDPNVPAPPGVAPGTTFVTNSTRGCSFYYTFEAVCKFLDTNNLLTVIRGHEAQDAGYTMFKKTPKRNFPSVITVFSAPNYLDVYRNRGAIIKYVNKNITIRQFNSSSHPFWLPNFMDAFTWSLPFVGSKITEMLLAVLSVCSQEELDMGEDSGEEDTNEEDLAARRQMIKNKILAVGKMQKVFQLLREEAENATELETDGASSSTRPPDGLTVQGTKINKTIRTFDDARRSDIANERLPSFPSQRPTIFPVPSMRLTSRRDSDGIDMDDLIKRTLGDDSDAGGAVERLADRLTRGRSFSGKHGSGSGSGSAGGSRDLKRHDTIA